MQRLLDSMPAKMQRQLAAGAEAAKAEDAATDVRFLPCAAWLVNRAHIRHSPITVPPRACSHAVARPVAVWAVAPGTLAQEL